MNVKHFAQFLAFALLLLGVPILAAVSRPAEMAALTISSAITLAFLNLDKIKRFKGGGFEAELREKVDAIIEKETEVDFSELDVAASPLQASVDRAKRSVLKALENPNFTWRYRSGIKKETGLSESDIAGALTWSIINGYARRAEGKHGPIYSITEQGRQLSIVQDFDDLTQ